MIMCLKLCRLHVVITIILWFLKEMTETYAIPSIIDDDYDCSDAGYNSYPFCKERGEGFVAYPNPTLFFECVKLKNGTWLALCYTCNEKFDTEFCKEYMGCTSFNVSSPNVNDSLTYSCDGYNEQHSFPCKYYEGQTKVHPGDQSVYWECVKNPNHDYIGICHVCPKEDKSCYVESLKRCVKNCGTLEKPKPYHCSGASFTCTKEGLFKHPQEPTIFFKCQKDGKNWKVSCYTCSSDAGTCFNDGMEACVLNGGKNCTSGKTPEESRTYDCSGYKPEQLPHPCSKGQGRWAHPGDQSVYFECKRSEDGNYEITCKACSKEKEESFNELQRKCMVMEIPSTPKPPGGGGGGPNYSKCQRMDGIIYPCEREGLFLHPRASSAFIQCKKFNGKFVALCFDCHTNWGFWEHGQTCFSCYVPNEYLSYDCGGYGGYNNWESLVFAKVPCGQPGYTGKLKEHPGDLSVYFECDPANSALCRSCPLNTCFDKNLQKCTSKACRRPKLMMNKNNTEVPIRVIF